MEIQGLDPKIDLLVDYLNGELGCLDVKNLSVYSHIFLFLKDQTETAKITQLIITGNSLQKPTSTTTISSPIHTLDVYLHSITTSLPVLLLPGSSDPTNLSIPQQPFRTGMFPKSSSVDSFVCGTNPSLGEVDGVEFLCSSGQNVDDVYKYVGEQGRLEIMEEMMKWGHFATTAPDTLCKFLFIYFF